MEHTVVSGEVILVTTIRSEVPRYYRQRDSSDSSEIIPTCVFTPLQVLEPLLEPPD